MAKITCGNAAAGLQLIARYTNYAEVTIVDGKLKIAQAQESDQKMKPDDRKRLASLGFKVELGIPPGVPSMDSKGQPTKPVPVSWVLG